MGVFIIRSPNYPPLPATRPQRKVCMNVLQTQTNDKNGVAALTALEVDLTTECSSFAWSINSAGTTLTPRSPNNTTGAALVTKVRQYSGKKVTWSFGGGAQNAADMETAISTNKDTTVATIVTHTVSGGYDGVKLDIENTSLDAQVYVDFITALRAALDASSPGYLITMDVQPSAYQNVWSRINEVESMIDNIYIMVYDIVYTTETIKSRTMNWVSKMNGRRDKISPGLAILDALDRTLTLDEFKEIIYWVKENNFGGIMIWNNYQMETTYYDAIDTMWG